MPEIPKIVLPHGGYRKLIGFERESLSRHATRGRLQIRLTTHGTAFQTAV